jgi:probable H4MPT-linked C1 transfer pathway protein
MSRTILGWDVGGANIKAAFVTDPDAAPSILVKPFPLWREPAGLAGALRDVAAPFGAASAMAITMTGELADCFATKREGVVSILDAFRTAFPGAVLWVYGVDGRFRSVEAASRKPLAVAAANWAASATLVARTFPDALFIDTGSTTTDVIAIVAGRIAARGRTDPARLRTGELVYTGALRTPVCAIVRAVPLRGRRCRVAAEHFAIAADVHLWLGRIREQDYTCETPDGRGRTRRDAAARIARMVCGDLEMLRDDDVSAIAEHVAWTQEQQIARAIRRVVDRSGPVRLAAAVVAGQGAFLGRAAAEAAGLTTTDLGHELGAATSMATPAAAVARLLAETAGV